MAVAGRPGLAAAAGLLDFLDAGAPPVYVGFGSMAGIDAATLVTAIGAVAQGRRVLFQPGWSGIDPARLPPVVVPFAGDQFFWAQRLAAQGSAVSCPAARLAGAARRLD